MMQSKLLHNLFYVHIDKHYTEANQLAHLIFNYSFFEKFSFLLFGTFNNIDDKNAFQSDAYCPFFTI